MRGPNLLPVATLAVWGTCALVGVLGFLLRYPELRTESKPDIPVQAVQVEVIKPAPPVISLEMRHPEAKPAANAPDEKEAIPEPPKLAAIPAAPAPVAVAAPSAAVSFAVPVEGPTRIVEVANAGHGDRRIGGTGTNTASENHNQSGPTAAPATTLPAVTKLTFGEGEGNQPAPDYPRAAVVGHQEGTVDIQFSVSEDGRVSEAQVISGSRWPLLNQAALRTVRERWRFGAGNKRLYEVSIQFQLAQ